MAKVVLPYFNRFNACCIIYSLSVSRLEVASSWISNLGSFKIALAMVISCRSPPEMVYNNKKTPVYDINLKCYIKISFAGIYHRQGAAYMFIFDIPIHLIAPVASFSVNRTI